MGAEPELWLKLLACVKIRHLIIFLLLQYVRQEFHV